MRDYLVKRLLQAIGIILCSTLCLATQCAS